MIHSLTRAEVGVACEWDPELHKIAVSIRDLGGITARERWEVLWMMLRKECQVLYGSAAEPWWVDEVIAVRQTRCFGECFVWATSWDGVASEETLVEYLFGRESVNLVLSGGS